MPQHQEVTMFRYALALTAALVSTAAVAADLSAGSFTRWRDYIRPAPAEMRWTEIPWHVTFAEGVAEAQAKEKPILAWVMNGHPLACT
jgi:hypothetical protein